MNSGSRAWEGGGQEGLPPAVAKQRPGPSRMDGPDHLIDQHPFPILASSCEILPPGDLPASPRGRCPGGRKSCTQQLRAGPALQPGPSVETRTASASAPRAPRRPARLPGNPARHARGLGPGPGSARAAGPHCWSGSGQGQPPHRGMRAQEGPPEAVVPREGHKSPRRAWSQGELRTPAAADGEAPRMPVSTRVP